MEILWKTILTVEIPRFQKERVGNRAKAGKDTFQWRLKYLQSTGLHCCKLCKTGLSQSSYSRGKTSTHLASFPCHSTSPHWNTVTLSEECHWSFLFSKVCPWEAQLSFYLAGIRELRKGTTGARGQFPGSQGLNSQSSSLNRLSYYLLTLQTTQISWGAKITEWKNFIGCVCTSMKGGR